MKHQPPRAARKFFEWLAGSASIDDLLGDLEEIYYADLKTRSPWRAKLKYWKQVVSLSFSYAIRKRKRDAKTAAYASHAFSVDMFRNYIKVTLRNLYKYKYFSLLNTLGLAIGMSVSLLLISIISYVRTYDDFHAHKDNIYTIISDYRDGIEESRLATAPSLVAEKITSGFSGVQQTVRIIKDYGTQIRLKNEDIPLKSYYVEPSFFSIFSFALVQGQALSLSLPYKAVLTRSAALKLFDTSDVMGLTIQTGQGKLFEVVGLMEDHPKNSHLNFDMLLSYSSVPPSQSTNHEQLTDFQGQYVYVLLNEDASPEDLQRSLDKMSAEIQVQNDVNISFEAQPLKEIAMGPDLRHDIGIKWEASGFYLFAVFAALILLPACFNYANISIARALRRAKEIGIRKTMGGIRSQVFLQFITETVAMAMVSLPGALLVFILIRQEFQSMMVSGSALDLSITWRMFFWFVVFAVVTGLVAGIFPAMHFARINPMQALKNKVVGKGSLKNLRKGLSIFQFALSFGFILTLVVFSRQYRYSLNFDFGFEKDNVVNVALHDVDPQLFRTAFAQLAPVKSVSMSSGLPGVNVSQTWVTDSNNDSTEIAQLFIDQNFIHNLGLTFMAGKNFPHDFSGDERYVIVNEEFIKHFGIQYPLDAVGKIFKIDGQDLEVIGVLKNFHFEPLNKPIGKFFFRMDESKFAYANLQVAGADPLQLFSQLENTWKKMPTQRKFDGWYFEDELNEAYQTYAVLLKIVGFLGVLAITISLLGMLGMVVYTAEARTKEVSIRKVMGAGVVNITMLLSGEYLKMMGWAMFLAIPVTVFVIGKLLAVIQYYRVSVSAYDIIFSALILMTLGISTIVSQTYKTATLNPAETLRSE